MVLEYNFLGTEAEFHHIGLAVNSIKNINSECKIITDKIQNVSVSFIRLNGINFELIEPLNDFSPIIQSLKKGIKLLHICYEVNDIYRELEGCRRHGFHCIAKPVPAIAFNGRKIAWIYNAHYGLFELLARFFWDSGTFQL